MPSILYQFFPFCWIYGKLNVNIFILEKIDLCAAILTGVFPSHALSICMQRCLEICLPSINNSCLSFWWEFHLLFQYLCFAILFAFFTFIMYYTYLLKSNADNFKINGEISWNILWGICVWIFSEKYPVFIRSKVLITPECESVPSLQFLGLEFVSFQLMKRWAHPRWSTKCQTLELEVHALLWPSHPEAGSNGAREYSVTRESEGELVIRTHCCPGPKSTLAYCILLLHATCQWKSLTCHRLRSYSVLAVVQLLGPQQGTRGKTSAFLELRL